MMQTSSVDPDAADGDLVSQIRQQSRQLVRELNLVDGECRGTEFTLSQCHVLLELSMHGPLNLVSLAKHLLVDKSTASRTVNKLVELGLVAAGKSRFDNRKKIFSLTRKGEQVLGRTHEWANQLVERALDHLDQQEQQRVMEGLQLYAGALRKSRLQSSYVIRPIQKRDNSQVARIIREVMTEFQAIGQGYSIGDAEVDDMYGNYRDQRSCYYVVASDQQVVGGAGIAPLAGGGKQTCELRKMFFLPSVRGFGLGRKLLLLLLDQARQRRYKYCYLETLDRMWQANQLYQRNGFEQLDQPCGNTGHCSCDRWYKLKL